MTAPTESRRVLYLGAALAVAVTALAGILLRKPTVWLDLPLYDYVAFWSAGRLNAQGQDAYDPQLLRAVQTEAVPELSDVLVMWPAPWALGLLKPFCLFESRVSHLLWMLFNLGVVAFTVDWCWRSLGRPTEQRGLAWMTAFTFVPVYFVLLTGQMGPLMLLGFVGFLHFLKRGRDGWAGAFLVLAAIKPQLSYLFWIALLVWAIAGRRWRLVLGGVLAAAALLAWPLWDDPQLLTRYWRALTQRNATHGHWSPVWGTALRFTFGRDLTWLQFLPTIPGLAWLAWYGARHRHNWDWQKSLTPLLFASLLTASYGAWPFDLLILLPALLDVAATLPGAPRRHVALVAAWFAAVNLLALVMILHGVEYFWFIWMTPALLLGWLGLRRAPAPETEPCRAILATR